MSDTAAKIRQLHLRQLAKLDSLQQEQEQQASKLVADAREMLTDGAFLLVQKAVQEVVHAATPALLQPKAVIDAAIDRLQEESLRRLTSEQNVRAAFSSRPASFTAPFRVNFIETGIRKKLVAAKKCLAECEGGKGGASAASDRFVAEAQALVVRENRTFEQAAASVMQECRGDKAQTAKEISRLAASLHLDEDDDVDVGSPPPQAKRRRQGRKAAPKGRKGHTKRRSRSKGVPSLALESAEAAEEAREGAGPLPAPPTELQFNF